MSDLATIGSHRGIAMHRINAMILRYWYLLISSWPRLLELMYWPLLQIITWGFLQTYVAQNSGFFAQAGGTLIGAIILWDILFRGQLGFAISFLEEMWARNVGNLMMTPPPASPRRWRSIRASTCACSPNPPLGPTAAWRSRSPVGTTRPPPARSPAPPRPACASTDRHFPPPPPQSHLRHPSERPKFEPVPLRRSSSVTMTR